MKAAESMLVMRAGPHTDTSASLSCQEMKSLCLYFCMYDNIDMALIDWFASVFVDACVPSVCESDKDQQETGTVF